MPIVSIGDMSQHFLSLKSGGSIKSDLARLGQELSTGKVADLTAHLGGDTRHFSGIAHSLSVIGAYQNVAKETTTTLDQMQIVLDRVDQSRSSAADSLLIVSEQSQAHQIDHAGELARQAFGDIVNSLNGQFAGRRLFGGSEVQSQPLMKSEEMLADILASIGGTATTAGIVQAVDNWFDDPLGGFASSGYQGDTGQLPTRRISDNLDITINVRADDPAIRGVLKAAALGALVSELDSSLTQKDLGNLLQQSGTRLLEASGATTQLQARIGNLQALVATGQARLETEGATLSMAQNDLENADPFETATRLEAVQTQLETHYTVTSRLSRMSLVEYI